MLGGALLEREIQIEVVQGLGDQFPAECGRDIAKLARRDHVIARNGAAAISDFTGVFNLPMEISMRLKLRRILVAIGLVLLIGGWGMTQYAGARQESMSQRNRAKAWMGEAGYVSGTRMYAGAILGMAVGAVLVVFCKD